MTITDHRALAHCTRACTRRHAARSTLRLWRAGAARARLTCCSALPIAMVGLRRHDRAVLRPGSARSSRSSSACSCSSPRSTSRAASARSSWCGCAGRASPQITTPDWQDARARTGFFGWLRAVLGNGHYWLYLLHTMVVDFIVSTVQLDDHDRLGRRSGSAGSRYWFWERFLPHPTATVLPLAVAARGASAVPARRRRSASPGHARSTSWLGAGLPRDPAVRDARPHPAAPGCVARGMLGAFAVGGARAREVATSARRAAAAIAAEGHSLRRLERDIHDGPQQRLVRLQMDLAAAERQLDSDPERPARCIAEAMQQSQGRARRAARPVPRLRPADPARPRPRRRARVARRCAAPLPTRVDEHAAGRHAAAAGDRAQRLLRGERGAHERREALRARPVEIAVGLRRVPERDETWLDVTVTDDGRGGAAAIAGHGLAGLEERVRGLGGTLEVHSPAGGPTVVHRARCHGRRSTTRGASRIGPRPCPRLAG